MKVRIVALALCTFGAAALGYSSPADVEKEKAALIRTDNEFSEAAQRLGVGEAFARNADESATMLPVALSGDLGDTLGTYESRGPGPDGRSITRYGKDSSVWKKQKDGAWKWVVDVGTPRPEPESSAG